MTGQEADADPLHFIEESSPVVAAPVIASLDEHDANRVLCEWDDYWRLRAHPGQIPPEGAWLVWLVMGGRGFGKTRAGAEWVRSVAEANPYARIALVGSSLGEVRSVMVEGEAGEKRDHPVHQC